MRETMLADPFSGTIYVFRAKRADRVKLIYWDGTGVLPVSPSGSRTASFQWPSLSDGVMRLTAAEFAALLEGASTGGGCTLLGWFRVPTAPS